MNITVYGTSACSQCKTVKSFLDTRKVMYNYKTVGEDVAKPELEQIAGRAIRSVPVIMVDGTESTFDTLKRHVGLRETNVIVAGIEL